MLSLIITIVLLAIIWSIVWWGWGQIGPKIAEPFKSILMIIIVIGIVVTLIMALTGDLRIPIKL